jgi:hypothetical protein
MGRVAMVLAGIALQQAILFGPSLLGTKILLPVDILAQPGVCVPITPGQPKVVPHDTIPSDQVFEVEPGRKFALRELRAGRLPLWCPYQYTGVPSFRWNLSPPCLPRYLVESPKVLAWTQMLLAMVAGLGAYGFLRRALGVGFWPAALIAWCYPISGAFVVWQGFTPSPVICWLPWTLLATDMAVREPRGWGGVLLALVTCLALNSGQPDVAGQVLLCSGLYAVWCYLHQYRTFWTSRRSWPAVTATVLGWTLGILASAWFLWPMAEYVQTGERMKGRSAGKEERPPGGIESLPLVVLPEVYGRTQQGSLFLGTGNVPESAVGGYAGLLAALLAAPLAFCSRKHLSSNIFWILLGFFGLAWALDVPGLVALLRMPGLRMMSHNRLVFVTSFAILAMAAVGLDALWQRQASRRWWFLLPMALSAVIGAACVYRMLILPEPLATQLETLVRSGRAVAAISDLDGVLRAQRGFVQSHAIAAVLCGLSCGGWFWLWSGAKMPTWVARGSGALLIGELLWFAYGTSAQCDPALYYPQIPAFEPLLGDRLHRSIGYQCLPANIPQFYGLHDIRGYDGVEPQRIIDLMAIAAPDSPRLPYTAAQWLMPKLDVATGTARLSPIMDMFGVRYLVLRGTPPPGFHAEAVSPDYWVLANPRALPRVFVPRRVEVVADDAARLQRLASPTFDARDVAYVESPLDLPGPCQGSAQIVDEVSNRIDVSLDMETAGLVVLADRWDQGWQAYLDDEPVPILRTNHALRGVVVPAGQQTLQWRYEPASLRWGARIAGLAVLIWLGWMVLVGSTARYRVGWETSRPAAPQPAADREQGPGKGRAGARKPPAHRRGRRR